MKLTKGWQFWIDRGGTFTDVVAKAPDGSIFVDKLLSENPEQYPDAPVQGIRNILGISQNAPIPADEIEVVKMGTTVATNALLERRGEAVVLVINQGFQDALRIGYQNRPDLFAQEIILPEMLYQQVIEVDARYDAQGNELISLNLDHVREELQGAYNSGIRSCAIVLMHGYRYPHHEQQIAQIASEINFTHISVSHQVSPLMKLVSRGDTTVVDAYLSPILKRYVNQVKANLSHKHQCPKLMFMQSNGGLADAEIFQGKDSILSGPAGGVVGAVKTCELAGFRKIIGFDMGGTSTDVSHYAGEYERSLETEIAGVRLRTPMMAIHTVAAGGGSILSYHGGRYRVGPDSAGANPGPSCYDRNGPLTVTDCNVMVGKLQPQFFPQVFGLDAHSPLNGKIVKEKFAQLAAEIGDGRNEVEVAAGFLAIAVEKMANAIKKISLQKGYDVSEYVLCCFGGAGGQHACLIAESLGMKKIFIHPYAGVLSAYGMGLAEVRIIQEQAVEQELKIDTVTQSKKIIEVLRHTCQEKLAQQETKITDIDAITIIDNLHLKYQGTDSTLTVKYSDDIQIIRTNFEQIHKHRYGFIIPEKQLVIESVFVELVCPTYKPEKISSTKTRNTPPQILETVSIYTKKNWYDVPVYQRENLQNGDIIIGPALIVETTGTNVIEPHWQAEIAATNNLILEHIFTEDTDKNQDKSIKLDPVKLEIFNNLFRSVAEQMGTTLQNTSYSVNIKERLDFSCAIFGGDGQLVANAPHIPVHLGSMSDSVCSLIKSKKNSLKPGDVYMLNNPYNGGTHLPDITVITPIFIKNLANNLPVFYVASRGHHADIGGITPGSMPPHSTDITQEGILIDHFQLVKEGIFQEQSVLEILTNNSYPARNPNQNLADLQAQIAANEKGVQELHNMINHYGLNTVQSYMIYVQNNATECVKKVIDVLTDGTFTCELDQGAIIKVTITIDKANQTAKIDFTGTSPQLKNNFNAPVSVCKAAVLYVFRTLVNDDIPLNAGCLKPLEIIIPEGCMLNPVYPAAVVAGNVETSQLITDCLYGALGVRAASQGTMNNFTFGNEKYQYYETICGGAGAGFNFNGTDAVQTHMTNSRLTDPEVLEWRYPVLLENFSIRKNSGGKGVFSGGNGVIRKIRFLEPMTAGILSSRRTVAPFGLKGGENGQTGRNYVIRNNGDLEELKGTATVEMQTGDTFVIETPGGGGYSKSQV